MGKLVKYCTSCNEGFAEKFGFCPNCGSQLQTFEMKPVEAAPVVETPPAVVAAPIVPPAVETPPPAIVETPAAPEVVTAPVVKEAVKEPEPVVVPQPKPVVPAVAATVPFVQKTPVDVDRVPRSLEAEKDRYERSGGFYVTVIEEKNVNQRNGLIVGTFGFMIVALMFGLVYSIFAKDLDIGAINDNIFDAVIVDTAPMEVEPQQKKAKDDGGGGGGGGKNEKEPASKGDLPDQTPNPTRPPDVNTPRMENPSLVLDPPSTQGNVKNPKIYDRWGVLNGGDTPSNGTGSGGGIGSGRGTGVGSGNGTGQGSGDGSGSGGGLGNGNGNGTGPGDGTAPPPPKSTGVTQGIRITSKPKPSYTDSARQNQIQGTVILRVTFLGSGQIGSISPVKGLPNGLTEQAIAAARSMRFEPAKVNGAGVTVTKQVEYTFSIY